MRIVFTLLFSLFLPFSVGAQTLGIQPAGSTPGGAHIANAVDFDGTNDHLERGGALTGAVDDAQGMWSIWIRIDGGDGTNLVLWDNASARQRYFRSDNNQLNITHKTTTGAPVYADTTSPVLTQSANWHHIIMSYNNLSSGFCQMYVDDVDNPPSGCNLDNALYDNTDTDCVTI